MSQRDALLQLVRDFCDNRQSRTFTLQDLNAASDYATIGIGGRTPVATVRRLLQELRDTDNAVVFNEEKGSYTLRGQTLLKGEVSTDTEGILKLAPDSTDTQEHLIETFARNRGWVKQAKEVLGTRCLYPKCANTFLKRDGQRYIEVHHIIPLHAGGEDGIWNLSVVCAHHHRMAHFADEQTKMQVLATLMRETRVRLEAES